MDYPLYIKCLKSLYENGNSNITLEKLDAMLSEGSITSDEYTYITSK